MCAYPLRGAFRPPTATSAAEMFVARQSTRTSLRHHFGRRLAGACVHRRPTFGSNGASSEHDGLVARHEHAIFEMVAHRAREDDAFEIAPLADQIFDRVAVCYPHHVLLEDWPFVEV